MQELFIDELVQRAYHRMSAESSNPQSLEYEDVGGYLILAADSKHDFSPSTSHLQQCCVCRVNFVDSEA